MQKALYHRVICDHRSVCGDHFVSYIDPYQKLGSVISTLCSRAGNVFLAQRLMYKAASGPQILIHASFYDFFFFLMWAIFKVFY